MKSIYSNNLKKTLSREGTGINMRNLNYRLHISIRLSCVLNLKTKYNCTVNINGSYQKVMLWKRNSIHIWNTSNSIVVKNQSGHPKAVKYVSKTGISSQHFDAKWNDILILFSFELVTYNFHNSTYTLIVACGVFPCDLIWRELKILLHQQ